MLVLTDCYLVFQCDQNGGGGVGGGGKSGNAEGPASWATSFEKLLDDPVGLHAFAVSKFKSNQFIYVLLTKIVLVIVFAEIDKKCHSKISFHESF